ncbi:MAG: FG-GAP-like repeat-containing protein, partial [Candidatus Heimdallarchaeaceae archaeon]
MQKKKKFITIMLIVFLCVVSLKNTRFEITDIHSTYSFDSYLEWKFEASYDFFTSAPCVADLDGNGLLEILMGSGSSDGRVYCWDYTGKELWTFDTEHFVMGAPSIADGDGDGKVDVLINSITTLYCLDNEGKEKWSYKIGKIRSAPCIADIDNDGELDIVISAFPGNERSKSNVYCLNGLGEVKWVYTHSGAIWYSVAVADLDDDNTLEILFSSHDKKLH